MRVAELHYEEIHPSFAEVGGVEVTHTNGHSRVQGFRWGETVAGYQFHPEWSPRDAGAVLDRHLTLLDTRHADPAVGARVGGRRRGDVVGPDRLGAAGRAGRASARAAGAEAA